MLSKIQESDDACARLIAELGQVELEAGLKESGGNTELALSSHKMHLQRLQDQVASFTGYYEGSSNHRNRMSGEGK